MESYRFFGWDTSDKVRTENGWTPCALYDLLRGAWCAETCAPRLRGQWSAENPTCGQCSVTAFLAQDLFGGKVCGVPLEDGNFHCFNVVDGCVFDLTSEQFDGRTLRYDNCPEQQRAVHFAKTEKLQRYALLISRVLAQIPDEAPGNV